MYLQLTVVLIKCQLKQKNKKLKEKLDNLEILNADMQKEMLSTKQFLQIPTSRWPGTDSNQDVINALKKRIVPALSEDKVEVHMDIFHMSFFQI